MTEQGERSESAFTVLFTHWRRGKDILLQFTQVRPFGSLHSQLCPSPVPVDKAGLMTPLRQTHDKARTVNIIYIDVDRVGVGSDEVVLNVRG